MNIKRCLVIFILGCCLCIAGTVYSQQKPAAEVSVTGIDGVLLENVLSSLCLVTQRVGDRQAGSMVRRCYDMADAEIEKALEPFGYYSPTIRKSMLQEDTVWKVHLDISPGEPVRITEVDIQLSGQGMDDPSINDAVSGFSLGEGDVLDHQLYEQGKKVISSKAITAGYRDALFTKSTVEVDRKQLAARILLTLDTGPHYLFGATTFEADFLSHGLLNRMLPFKEGDAFSPRKIVQLRQAFLNSDYFSRVEVETGDPAAGTQDIPVLIRLSPKKKHRYGLGAGYGTDTGFRGSLEWSNRLVNKYGHQFNMQLQPSERKSNFGAVYTIPVNDPKTDRLSLHGRWEKELYDNTETEQINTAVSYDHIRKNGEYSIYLEFLDEDYEIGSETGHATLMKPGIRTTWRLTDDRLRTRNGISATLDLTGASQEIVSDATFVQASFYSKAIMTVFDEWRIIGKVQLGATLVDSISDLPPSLRFYAGGDQSVRGFAYKSIGPTDPQGDVVGASHLVAYSLELERKLFGNWSGALFFDSGDATNSLTDLNMKRGVGAGLRWNAPFGQVRLDVANGVSEGKSSWRIHFNVGADL